MQSFGQVCGHRDPSGLETGATATNDDPFGDGRVNPAAHTDDDGIERACAFLIDQVRQKHGARWRQGLRKSTLGSWSGTASERAAPRRSASESVLLVLEYRLCNVCDDAVRGVAAWQAGLPVTLLTRVPEPRTLLGLQARGARCVSLLPPHVCTEPHADALEFLLHDLRHVGKFADPEFYAEQAGFFAVFMHALEQPKWIGFESELDAGWISDRDHVLADMNGSSVFLFAALKMRLKMAARRKVSGRLARPAPREGVLSAAEHREFTALLEKLLDALEFEGELRHAAVVTSTRRDCPRIAALLAAHFRTHGKTVLARAYNPMKIPPETRPR